jgi:hypothetical protein
MALPAAGDVMFLPAARDLMFLTAAGMRKYCYLEGYDNIASCKECYVSLSCRDEKVLPARRLWWHCQLQGMFYS